MAIGSHWFAHLCAEQRSQPHSTFRSLIHQHGLGAMRGPMNLPARRAAGFDEVELAGQMLGSEAKARHSE